MPDSRGRPRDRQPTGASTKHNKPRETSPTTPSGPATPSRSNMGHSKPRHGELMANWFFRSLTLLSVFYLVFDRIYETSATISAPAPDALKPFSFPFSVRNNSHFFWFAKHFLVMHRNPSRYVKRTSI